MENQDSLKDQGPNWWVGLNVITCYSVKRIHTAQDDVWRRAVMNIAVYLPALKWRTFVERMSYYQLLKKSSIPWDLAFNI